ncbi:MAG: hypothetical protein RLO80_13320 [Hyphomonas sp.]
MAEPDIQDTPEPESELGPYANQLDQVGNRKRILRLWQTGYLPRLGKHVQFMQFGKDGLRPLIWLHSIEYPMSPPWGMCVDAADKGFSIVSVRRPGFGETSAAASADEEAALLEAFILEAGFENAVLLAEGTSRPAALKLAQRCDRIAFTVLARPAYSSEGFGDIEPWFRDLILQTLQTKPGASLSMAALTHLARQSGHASLYEGFLKIGTDTMFVRSHARDLAEAWDCFRAIKTDTFRRDMKALEPDPSLTPGALAGLPALAVIGIETPEVWRNGFEKRSAELGIRTAFLPSGSLFALYQNPDALLDLISAHC